MRQGRFPHPASGRPKSNTLSNLELLCEFENAMEDGDWSAIAHVLKSSDDLLEAAFCGDAKHACIIETYTITNADVMNGHISSSSHS